jgi:hypothetical protein
MTLTSIKQSIWCHKKINRNPVNVQVYADKAKVRLPITQVHEAEKLLKLLNKGAKKPKRKATDEVYQRYRAAKLAYETVKYPNWIRSGHFIEPDMPTEDTNGLTGFILEFLLWSGHFANRTGNEGRVLKDGTRIPSGSKKGMQDIDTNLKHSQHKFGIPWKIEVKAGNDTHKEHQKEYGRKVSSTGGHYSVVKSCSDFLEQYDKLMLGDVVQSSIFD